jgi:hypothetical protein
MNSPRDFILEAEAEVAAAAQNLQELHDMMGPLFNGLQKAALTQNAAHNRMRRAGALLRSAIATMQRDA